ncbi:MAG TPA: hypothetical protein VF665_23000 [Longimicrobium sp.]|jgi:hypothetical protein|uniref:hypothetical protein n=1 Tax=Longimicrobium sp. TaxID=2029185 RepID=UPI002EDB5DD4
MNPVAEDPIFPDLEEARREMEVLYPTLDELFTHLRESQARHGERLVRRDPADDEALIARLRSAQADAAA